MQSILLLSLFTLVFLGIAWGIPVLFVLMGAPVIVALVGSLFGIFDATLFAALPIRIFGIFENQILYSVPLFILMGKLLEHSGLATRALITLASLARQPSTRSLSLSVLAVSVIIACSSGIVGATVTMLATIALPVLLRSGMDERLSAGLIIAAGSLGQIIPPSIVLILLSDQISNAHMVAERAAGNFATEPISVAHLFAGALVPGFILAILYGAFTVFRLGKTSLLRRDSDGFPDDQNNWPALLTILALVGVPLSILFGIATPTEAAGIGVILILLLSYFETHRPNIRLALKESADLIGIIFGIIIAASIFALVVRGLEGDLLIENTLTILVTEPQIALLIVLGLVFVMGFFIEFVEITYIVVPLTAPFLFSLGIDPMWFAILMAVNLQISFLPPPMGISLFYFKSVTTIKTGNLYRAVLPFIGIQLIVLLVILLFPPLATWLPSVLI